MEGLRVPALRAAILLATLPLVACTVTAVPPTEADRNREKVIELERQVAQLQGRIAGLEAALAAADARAPTRTDGTPVAAEVLATAPFATTLRIGRFSGVATEPSVGRVLRLYLEPLDARGESVQVAGSATIEVLWIDPAGVSHQVAAQTLDPAAWRERFRSGFMGRHYTVEVPLAASALPAPTQGSLLARVGVNDGLTGRTLSAESLFELRTLSSTP